MKVSFSSSRIQYLTLYPSTEKDTLKLTSNEDDKPEPKKKKIQLNLINTSLAILLLFRWKSHLKKFKFIVCSAVFSFIAKMFRDNTLKTFNF